MREFLAVLVFLFFVALLIGFIWPSLERHAVMSMEGAEDAILLRRIVNFAELKKLSSLGGNFELIYENERAKVFQLSVSESEKLRYSHEIFGINRSEIVELVVNGISTLRMFYENDLPVAIIAGELKFRDPLLSEFERPIFIGLVRHLREECMK